MYLVQADRLKHKRPAAIGRGPAEPRTVRAMEPGAITLAFPMLTFGLFIGLALMVAARTIGGEDLAWTDPKVLATAAFWLVFALLLHARFRPEWRGTRVMVLTAWRSRSWPSRWWASGAILPTATSGQCCQAVALEPGRTP